ncbi:hypothetical protein BWK58_14710 [Flavobacterium columnare]|nr:hypothetical protein BWK58_14710 [Flavobacterium columnare]
MKINKLINSFLGLVLLQSCTSQTTDISNLSFPIAEKEIIKDVDAFKKEQYIYALGLSKDYENFEVYKSNQKVKFSYNTLNLDGGIENLKRYQNKIDFIRNGNDKKIYGYELVLYSNEKSLELLKLINQKIGKPNYDDAEDLNRNIIWEIDNQIYYLNINKSTIYNNKKTITSTLRVISTKLSVLSSYLTNPTYYEDYLKEREKKKNNIDKFSYKLFAQEEFKNGNIYYFKGVKGLK